MIAQNLGDFELHGVFDDCADYGGPTSINGFMAQFARKNSDGTYTVVESVWGASCSTWDGDGKPEPPFYPSHAVTVTVDSLTVNMPERLARMIESR